MEPKIALTGQTLLAELQELFDLAGKINAARTDYFVKLEARVSDEVFNAWNQEFLGRWGVLATRFSMLEAMEDSEQIPPQQKQEIFGKFKSLQELIEQLESVGSDIIENMATDDQSETHQLQEHIRPMLSLSNAYTIDDLNRFKAFALDDQVFVVEPKHDGVAIELIYDASGNLQSASTRGDGRFGQYIDGPLGNIQGVVQTIHPAAGQASPPKAVYGEVVFLKDFMVSVNNQRIIEGLKPYTSMRAAAAGILRAFSNQRSELCPLMFIPYEVSYGIDVMPRYLDVVEWLTQNGFIQTHRQVITQFNMLEGAISSMEKLRDTLGHITDGLVIKNNLREDLSHRTNYPLRAMAYKFQAPSAVSELYGVDWSVGLNGRQIPTAILKPVLIRGHEYGRCNLYNMKKVRELRLGIGDQVLVELRGDVIPKITSVLSNDGSDYTPVVAPIVCVGCGGDVAVEEAEPYCKLYQLCPEALKANVRNTLKRARVKPITQPLVDELAAALSKAKHSSMDRLSSNVETLEGLSEDARKALKKVTA